MRSSIWKSESLNEMRIFPATDPLLTHSLFRLLQNVAPRIKAIPEHELALAITRSRGEDGDSAAKGSHDANQDVDIDVLQVQESSDGASTSSSQDSGDDLNSTRLGGDTSVDGVRDIRG